MTVPPRVFNSMSKYHQDLMRSAIGLRLWDEFLTGYGKHLFIFGVTGSGKSQKGLWTVDLLKYLENQIWFDTGKSNEILPLLCMDRKVRVIIPSGCDIRFEERTKGIWQKIPDHPVVIRVQTPNDAINAIASGSFEDGHNRIKDTITVISFRNFFSKRDGAINWVADFFESLAERCRLSTMPNIFPASIHIDESQWAMAGKRISADGERSRATEVITENALELRSARIRLVLYAQSYKNIPPAARENMLFHILNRGAYVTTEENGNLSKWCRNAEWRTPPTPMQYKPWHGRFIFENGDSWPPLTPWKFRLYPVDERDRGWIKRCRIVYEGRHDRRSESEETQEECFPEVGRFQALAIKPEVPQMVESRWGIPFGDINGE
jgi:hypothetical protein